MESKGCVCQNLLQHNCALNYMGKRGLWLASSCTEALDYADEKIEDLEIHVEELEKEVASKDEKINELEKEVASKGEKINELEKERSTLLSSTMIMGEKISELENKMRETIYVKHRY